MINQEFDHIISLGGHCQTSYQIRRHFGIDTAYPLDWWVTPTIALVRLFESGFADIFREENMRIVDEHTGPAVMCGHYGMMHYHDFDEAKINGIYSPYLVRTKCAINNSKFSYLMTRLLNVTGKVLFIRYSSGWVQNFPQGTGFTEPLLQRFMIAARAMLPNAEVNFLILNDYDHHVGLDGNPFPGVYTSNVNNYDEQHLWQGSNRGWTEMFEYQNIRWSGAAKPAAEQAAEQDTQQAA